MKVEFLKDWRGSKVGNVAEIVDDYCKYDLIPRGIVKPYKEPKPPKPKQITKPPVDKMLRSAVAK